MSLQLYELARLVNGTVSGNDQTTIQGVATLRDARDGYITLAAEPQHIKLLAESRASAAIVAADMDVPELAELPDTVTLITVSNPREAFAAVVRAFRPPRPQKASGISSDAIISPTAKIGEDAMIGPRCVIGDEVQIGNHCRLHPGSVLMAGTKLGDDVTIFPNAVLYENTIVGDRCIIHASAVIGAYGFGYDSSAAGHQLSEQLGYVVLEDDVDVGAGTTIDRGTYGPTLIGQGTKLDNQVVIGHNCRIGKHNLLCGQVGIAGSCSTGDFVVIAGQVGFRDHIDIGDHIQIGAKAGVANSLTEPGQYLGTPAIPIRQEIQTIMARQKLPEIRKQMKQLERTVEGLKSSLDGGSVEAA